MMMAFFKTQLSPKWFILLLNVVVYILMHVFCLVLQYNGIYSKLVEHFVKLCQTLVYDSFFCCFTGFRTIHFWGGFWIDLYKDRLPRLIPKRASQWDCLGVISLTFKCYSGFFTTASGSFIYGMNNFGLNCSHCSHQPTTVHSTFYLDHFPSFSTSRTFEFIVSI